MDSTNPTIVHQISDPVFRVWSKQFELIIKENQPQTSLVQFSIHPNSVHNKIWASSRSGNNEPDILREKTESILGKGSKLIQLQIFYDGMAAYRFVSSMLPLLEVDKFDKECLISQIISTVRKILKDNSSRTDKVLNKLWMMDLEMDITTVYYSDDHNLNFNEGKACMQHPLVTSDERGSLSAN